VQGSGCSNTAAPVHVQWNHVAAAHAAGSSPIGPAPHAGAAAGGECVAGVPQGGVVAPVCLLDALLRVSGGWCVACAPLPVWGGGPLCAAFTHLRTHLCRVQQQVQVKHGSQCSAPAPTTCTASSRRSSRWWRVCCRGLACASGCPWLHACNSHWACGRCVNSVCEPTLVRAPVCAW
jgi:hypothetical protein